MLTTRDFAQQSAERIKQFNQESHEAMLAFQAGKFPEYFRNKTKAIQDRLEEEYANLNADSDGGTTGENS